MNTINTRTTVLSLTKDIKNSLETISKLQQDILEWDLLTDEERTRNITCQVQLDITSVQEVLGQITNETIALFETMSSMNKVLLESIPEKEIVIYTQI